MTIRPPLCVIATKERFSRLTFSALKVGGIIFIEIFVKLIDLQIVFVERNIPPPRLSGDPERNRCPKRCQTDMFCSLLLS